MQKELEDKDIDLHIDRETLLQEYIPRAEFEQRLKADMAAMLTEIDIELDELTPPEFSTNYYLHGIIDAQVIIQKKIDDLKEA